MGPQEVKNAVRILTIDGGGIRGILPARLLQALEKVAVRHTTEMFDLIAGTSTGGIIGCGLVARVSPEDLADMYAIHGGEIFSGSLWRTVVTLDNLRGPKYAPDALEELLKKKLGEDSWLSSVTGPDLLVPSYCIQLPKPEPLEGSNVLTTRRPYFFKSWKASGRLLDPGEKADESDFQLWQIACATSAAPTYFPPATVTSKAGSQFAMIDGGVFANNPAMCALASARLLFDADKFIVVSLGTGSLERAINAKAAADWGEVQWLHPILNILMDGSADTVGYELDQMPEVQHHRFEISTGTDPSDPATVNEDFDYATPDNIARLEALARKLVEIHKEELRTVADLLKASPPAVKRKS